MTLVLCCIAATCSGLAAYVDIESRFRRSRLGLSGPLHHWPTLAFISVNAVIGWSVYSLGVLEPVMADSGAVVSAIGSGLGAAALLRSKLADVGGTPVGGALLYDYFKHKVLFHLHVHSTKRQWAATREIAEIVAHDGRGVLWMIKELERIDRLFPEEKKADLLEQAKHLAETLTPEDFLFWLMDEVGMDAVVKTVKAAAKKPPNGEAY